MYYIENEMCLIYDFYINNLIVFGLSWILVGSKTSNMSSNIILFGFIKLKSILYNYLI